MEPARKRGRLFIVPSVLSRKNPTIKLNSTILINFVMLLIGFGLTLGGSMALLVGGLAMLVSGSAVLPWIMAGLMGAITFILTLVVPLVFLGGLRAVFVSSAWTLTYRELGPLTKVSPQAATVPPALEVKKLEADASPAA